MKLFNTIKEATHAWVMEMNQVPMGVVEKLIKLDGDESIEEVTPPSVGDYVLITDGEHRNEHGEIIGRSEECNETLLVQVDGEEEPVEIDDFNVEVERDGFLPMWGTMWAFGDSIDNWWLEK